MKKKNPQKPKNLNPQTSPCGGGIFYMRGPKPNSLLVGCAPRAATVGIGNGISFGGYAEVAAILAKAVGKVQMMSTEILREAREELPGINKVIRTKELKRRLVYLTSFMVRTADINQVHNPVYFGIPVTGGEAAKISTLKPGKETRGPIVFTLLEWPPEKPGRSKLHTREKLYHKHERLAFKTLAERAENHHLPFLED